MNKQLKNEERLRHMLDAAREAVQFIQGKQRSDLDLDHKLALAIVRLLEIIGEAADNVSEDFCEQHPRIPWRKIAGTRNRLAHGYFDVDLDIVWQIIVAQLPPLIAQLEQIVGKNS